LSRRALLPASENQFFEAGTIKCPPWLTVADILRCPHRKIDFPRRARKKARLLKKQAQLPAHLSPYTLLVYIYIARVSFTHSPPPLGAPSPSPPTPLPLPHLSPSPSPDPAASLRRHLLPSYLWWRRPISLLPQARTEALPAARASAALRHLLPPADPGGSVAGGAWRRPPLPMAAAAAWISVVDLPTAATAPSSLRTTVAVVVSGACPCCRYKSLSPSPSLFPLFLLHLLSLSPRAEDPAAWRCMSIRHGGGRPWPDLARKRSGTPRSGDGGSAAALDGLGGPMDGLSGPVQGFLFFFFEIINRGGHI